MGRRTYFSLVNSVLPNFQYLTTTTAIQYNRGYMLNGVHFDDWKKLTVFVEVEDHETWCHSCRRHILEGEVIGADLFGMGDHFCSDCIELPDGLEIWDISYSMRRKSVRHPDGIKHELRVQKVEVLAEYADQLHIALKRVVRIEQKTPVAIALPQTLDIAAVEGGI